MNILQRHIRQAQDLPDALQAIGEIQPQLILIFGSVRQLSQPNLLQHIREYCPQARLAGCSTAGEILSEGVSDDSIVLTAVHFAQTSLQLAHVELADIPDSFAAGERLATALPHDGLDNVVLFGPGVNVNGSSLINGLRSKLPPDIPVSGGLAGDNGAFQQTLTLADEHLSPRAAVAIGFYGQSIQVQHGSSHGWVPFGPTRLVTRSEGNLLYELDGEPALDIYKRYLGEYARDLPASGLLFPFEMLGKNKDRVGLIRTILGIDEAEGMLILAGDIVPDGYLRLMHANTDSLVDGAEVAAMRAKESVNTGGDTLAILVSCVGRKLVMGARVDEEVEAIGSTFGPKVTLAGFYSYGEISPDLNGVDCKLHNQTMTITYLSESK